MNEKRAHWSGRVAFILAAAGSAVGLGNIWKFPYIAGMNGGGAFVLVYLALIAVVGIPIFLAELYIGQKGQANTVKAFEITHREHSPWRAVGLMGLLSAFTILSFYSVVCGWILDYAFRSLCNSFGGLADTQIEGMLGELFANPLRMIAWHFAFMLTVIAIVARGLQSGIERWSKILMPGLLILLCVLLVHSVFQSGFMPALHFLFKPDFSKLNGEAILEAAGHSFFTLSLGMGAMITYGSYLQRDENLVKTGITIAFLDTAIALIAGLVIFSAVFSYNFEPSSGPGLMFQTLPVLFQKMPAGYFMALIFFVLVAFAGFTSAISLLEVVVSYAEETHDMDRTRVAWMSGALIFALGVLCALSFNALSDFKIWHYNFFDLFDTLSGKLLLPLGGLLIAVFYGWVLGPQACAATIGKPSQSILVQGLLWSARIIAPLLVGVVLWNGLAEL